MKKTIHDFNLFYSLFRRVTYLATASHYRHFVIQGRENLPDDAPIILAPCHQNALMDPLVVLNLTRCTTVFIARADIFKKPVARFFLTWLRILPAFRIRDGRDQLGKNEDTFRQSRDVLLSGTPLCLMAEGRHNDKHQLLPLVKGMFRIAGETQKELGEDPLFIVPVGIDYDEYEQPFSNVSLQIGTPICVQDYMETYLSDEPVALNQMRDKLSKELKKVMHHVGAQDQYADEYAYCHLKTQETLKAQNLANNSWTRFQARKTISEQLAQLSEEERASKYAEGAAFAAKCDKQGVPMWFVSQATQLWKQVLGLLALILGVLICWKIVPLWFLANPIVYLPTHLIAKMKIKDPQFRSTCNYGIRFGLSLVYILIMFIISSICRNIVFGFGMLFLALFSAYFTPKILAFLRDCWYTIKMKRTK